MDETYETEEPDLAFQPGRFSWLTPLILGVQVVEEMGRAVVDGVGELKVALAAHANYQIQRDLFAAEAGVQLEQLTEGEQEY